ncbi:ABC transporter substrate-binding protein [Vallitalea okinawensis]|uniref:ABC transporter substrate-binding protein n=1 Tax=Vallitalea okinawensis TaxID=2078660 RepID=UPI001300883B|nr:extracellular solute-binding protein [Vallitalea okinawensis]
MRWLGLIFLSIISFIFLVSCQYDQTEEVIESVPEELQLSLMINVYGKEAEIIEKVASDYSVINPNIQIDVMAPGGAYENIMKIKLSSGDVPDLFSTHGWSVTRYADYLVNLNEKDWITNIRNEFRPFIEDKEGQIYVLPFNMDMTGIVYNKGIFEAYNLKEPQTYDELLETCEILTRESNGTILPFISAKDVWCEAQFFDFFAIPLLIDTPHHDYSDEFMKGNFDWSKWNWLAEEWQQIYNMGYVNKNMLSCNYNDNIKSFANGEAAMAFYGPYFMQDVESLNSEIELAMMPIPTIYEGGHLTLATGERSTLGVYKESIYKEEALELLDYFAEPENIAQICEASRLPSAFKGINSYEDFYMKENIKLYPYFDRAYLPDGMWYIMCSNSAGLVSGDLSVEDVSKIMEQEYKRLRSTKKGAESK